MRTEKEIKSYREKVKNDEIIWTEKKEVAPLILEILGWVLGEDLNKDLL